MFLARTQFMTSIWPRFQDSDPLGEIAIDRERSQRTWHISGETYTSNFHRRLKQRFMSMLNKELKRLGLMQIRQARQLTQTSLAEMLGVPQSAVSKLEHRTDMYISTLRSYVEARGGSLEIKAVFPDAEIVITQFEEIDEEKPGRASQKQAIPA